MGLFHSNIKNQIKKEIALLQEISCSEVDSLRKELIAMSNKNDHLLNKMHDENVYLKEVNTSLEKEIAVLKSNISQVDGGLSLTNLDTTALRIQSEKNIDEYIQKILDNPSTNIKWMPDVVEKQIYKNIMRLVLNAMESTVETSKIQFLGHQLAFVMDPIIKSD